MNWVTSSVALASVAVLATAWALFEASRLGDTSYPGLLLAIAIVGAALSFDYALKARGSVKRRTKTSWFAAALTIVAGLISFVDDRISNTQRGLLITVVLAVALLALAVAIAVSTAEGFRARQPKPRP